MQVQKYVNLKKFVVVVSKWNSRRCGDFGECEPKGADDYICICQDGNYFDEEIGTCLPVRSICKCF